jgi:hypothetical protein
MAAGITGGIVIGNKQWPAEISPAMGFAMIRGETAKNPVMNRVRARQPAISFEETDGLIGGG